MLAGERKLDSGTIPQIEVTEVLSPPTNTY